MPTLSDKTILILSPQSWGTMFISKHHYALELARMGNKVYFLNPPEYGSTRTGAATSPPTGPGTSPLTGPDGNTRKPSGIRIAPSGIHENLMLISHRLWFPYLLKFHAMPLFHAGMRLQWKRILKKIGRPIDIVWSFDLGNLCPLTFFGRDTFKIFHPVDEPSGPQAIAAAKGSDIIFSVTREILDKYKAYPAPKHFINHGISPEFLRTNGPGRIQGDPVRVGMAGNLLRSDIDRPTWLEMVRANPGVIFECWGSYGGVQSNMGGGGDNETHAFITALQALPNLILHGAVPAAELATGFSRMDAFLICYDIKKDQSGGTNYHKIMEYLSTGKVIVSNNVTTYKDMPVLMQMTAERDNNDRLPGLFRTVIGDLPTHNDPARQRERIEFARDNAYSRQLERIGQLIKDRK
jgi:glycosyltransferase involved in cell wall biosynthesis